MKLSGRTEAFGGAVYRLWLVRIPIGSTLQSKITREHQNKSLCGIVARMSQATKEIPVLVGGESGQRKHYLRALEKDLAAAFGPQWRDKLASKTVVKP